MTQIMPMFLPIGFGRRMYFLIFVNIADHNTVSHNDRLPTRTTGCE